MTPLSFDELMRMEGEPVWLIVPDLDLSEWAQVNLSASKERVWFWLFGNETPIRPGLSTYGKTWSCYRNKPERI